MSASFTTLKALDPVLVSQLKDFLPDPLFERLNGLLSIDQERLKFAESKIRVLEGRLRLLRIEKYGPGSENSAVPNWSCSNWSPESAPRK